MVGGAGGGFSTIEPEPSYQTGVSGTSVFHGVQYLTPTDYQTVAPAWSGPLRPAGSSNTAGRASSTRS